jgi:DNA-directed RNA polymerase specialized sigma24 family protein
VVFIPCIFVNEQLPQAEIAQMMGLENGTVRTQYHRAKTKIKEALKQGGYHER